jgi:hypothetical protein
MRFELGKNRLIKAYEMSEWAREVGGFRFRGRQIACSAISVSIFSTQAVSNIAKSSRI